MRTTYQTQSDPWVVGQMTDRTGWPDWTAAQPYPWERDLKRWPYLLVFEKLAIQLGLLGGMTNRTNSVPWNPGYVAVTHKIT